MGDTTQTSHTQNFPGFAGKNFHKFNDLFGSAIKGAKNDTTAGTDLARAQLTDTASGKYLDSSTNPWMQQVIGSMTGASNESFDRDLNKLAGTVNRAGFATTGKEIGQGGDLARLYSNQLGGQVGQLGANLYNTERGRQLASLQPLANLDNSGLDKAMQIGNFLRGLSSQTDSQQSDPLGWAQFGMGSAMKIAAMGA